MDNIEKNDIIEEIDEEEKIESLSDVIDKFNGYMDIQNSKTEMMDQLDKYVETGKKIKNEFTDSEKIDQLIDKKLDRFEDAKDLSNYLTANSPVTSKERILDFYTDEDGNVADIRIDFKSESDKLGFMKESLILFKTIDDCHKNIDEEFRKLDESTKEISKEMQELAITLSDNILSFIDDLKERSANLDPNSKEKKLVDRHIKYTESAYTLDLYRELIEKKPGIAKSTLKELIDFTDNEKTSKIESLGNRYFRKLRNNKCKGSLIRYFGDDDVLSFEERFLIKDDEYMCPNLFVYSIFRYFAMSDWNSSTKVAHSSMCILLEKIYNNRLNDELWERVRTNIVEYLKLFNK